MILVDSSVWVDHFRSRQQQLVAALNEQLVMIHPFVIGELACGNIPNRNAVLRWLEKLPTAPVATTEEAMALIEKRHLSGTGVGYVDVHVLASTLLQPTALLWTNDKRLALVAAKLRVGFDTA